MVTHFPIAHEDELLGSILARFVERQGIHEDKIACHLLFGSRNIAPAVFFQGHIAALMQQVGHIWKHSLEDIAYRHTLLPIFKPFVTEASFNSLLNEIIYKDKSHVMLKSGCSAGIVAWPVTYKVCPICYHDQITTYGYAIWQRTLQCPGVEACPEHECWLINSEVDIYPERKHKFYGPSDIKINIPTLSLIADKKSVLLSKMVYQLINAVSYSSISFDQWSRYYNIESKRLALLSHRGVNHKITDRRIHSYWGNDWMRHHGLSTDHGSDWIIKIFRKHKSSFSYLQHFSCWLGVRGDSIEIILHEELKKVLQYSESTNKTKKRKYSNNDEKRIEYRKEWISCLKKYEYLCDIRKDKNGRRFYSWLYRYDFLWLEKNKPVQKINKECFRNVDWKKRDRSVVRYLIDIERSIWQRLDGRRRSMSWYCQQLKVKSFYSLKVEKMPLCRLFFIKYAETVEEYQARRLAYHLSCMITAKRGEVNSYELYKKAGLSAKTIYQSVDIIIKKDIPYWI